jgi:hypothetical protein
MTDPDASPTAGKAPADPVIEAHDEHGAPRSRTAAAGRPAGAPADRPADAADEDPDPTGHPPVDDRAG